MRKMTLNQPGLYIAAGAFRFAAALKRQIAAAFPCAGADETDKPPDLEVNISPFRHERGLDLKQQL